MKKEIEEYYNEFNEDVRLKEDSVHYIEFLTTIKFFDKVFPRDSKILDACAGTGVYAFHLAKEGHRVIAGDITPGNVETMKKKQVQNSLLENIYMGDALDLSRFADESFDVVLCMGALYHLSRHKDRCKVVSECLRVLKSGGIFVGSYMNRLAVILQNCKENLDDIDELLRFHREGTEGPFYTSFPGEINAMMKDFSLEKLHHFGADGIGCVMYGIVNLITKKGFDNWRRYHYATCEEESILGYSFHGVYIGRKRPIQDQAGSRV